MIEVRTSDDTIEPFDKEKIVKSVMRETGVDSEKAREVAERVTHTLSVSKPSYLTTSLIRDLVKAQFIEKQEELSYARSKTIGVPVFDIEDTIFNPNRDNANMIHNPETIHKHFADRLMKDYALQHLLPHKLADAHMRGEIHIHDLEFFADRPLNCLQHDLRYFIRYGLLVDGTGDHTSVAGPPKHLETLMNHSGEVMLAAQQNMSGGQSISLWNVFAAPFAAGRTYDDIKQSVQMFIFNLNMAYAARGSQVPFTSLNVEFTIPDFLADEIAWGPNGVSTSGVTYAEYEEEARLLQRALTEVLLEGDSYGKPHLFPNTIYVLREEMMKKEFEEDLLRVHELSAKYGTAYFSNMLVDWRGAVPHANYMGCRTCLNSNWTGRWDLDTLKSGNLAYVTLNLPRLSYARGFEGFLENVQGALEKGKDVLLLRRKLGLDALYQHKTMPFLGQSHQGHSYYFIDNTTMSFGFVGLHEAMLNLFGQGLDTKLGQEMGILTLEFMNSYAKRLTEDTSLRWTVLQSPAETTAHRFAELDIKKFGIEETYVNGDTGRHYYSNSSHLPVTTDLNWPKRIKAESPFHPLTKGGHIFHVWLGEAHTDPEALMSLTKNIAKNSELGLWDYSTAFSFCLDCKSLLNGLVETCYKCGRSNNVEWYDRITGYVQQVGRAGDSTGGWNAGKRRELLDRTRMGEI